MSFMRGRSFQHKLIIIDEAQPHAASDACAAHSRGRFIDESSSGLIDRAANAFRASASAVSGATGMRAATEASVSKSLTWLAERGVSRDLAKDVLANPRARSVSSSKRSSCCFLRFHWHRADMSARHRIRHQPR
ncbi:hypothetical protein [Caballeronia sp. GaOx3]|uniref:hypothetical protein n=1 Tax=Caballeronia sp. GaOx3 TaxID=2921740 RepID=UPI0028B04595|nr:hypothetical protein [Caballeronia sp. GaOx3]